MSKIYFDIKLNNAAYSFQCRFDKTGLGGVYQNKPCCIAENGIVLGVNKACEQINIKINEPVEKALIKCADLYIEKPNYELINDCSLRFMKICSDFGIAKFLSYDKILLENDSFDESEAHYFIKAIKERISDELGAEANIDTYKTYASSFNKYSETVKADKNAAKILSARLSFKLKLDNAAARLFSIKVIDKSGIEHITDKRVAVPCCDSDMINFVIKTIFDNSIDADIISLSLFDIELTQQDTAAENKEPDIKTNLRRKKAWDYVKENKSITDFINKNGLYIYENLCEFLEENPLNLTFYELCALAEKANTRRLKLGNYYINPIYTEKFIKDCAALYKTKLKILINGYVPFLLMFMLNEYCRADLYYNNIDDKTLNIITKLEQYSPFVNLSLSPSHINNYDLIISYSINTLCKAKNEIIITKKAFLSSVERESIKSTAIDEIYDFGEFGFNGSFEQYIAIVISRSKAPNETKIVALDNNYSVLQKQRYITDDKLPCWILYRNKSFDSVYSKLQFGLFDIISGNNIKQRDYDANGNICVISAACIDLNGNVNTDKNCRYVMSSSIKENEAFNYIDRDDVFFASKKSTLLKVGKKPKGCIPGPSTVLLVPKNKIKITKDDLKYFSTNEFKQFYDTALNHQGFILSSDRISQYFLGKVSV